MAKFDFTANAMTCEGRTFPVGYSVTPSGSVMVFVTMPDAAEPVRIKFEPDHPGHAAALAAARGELSGEYIQPEETGAAVEAAAIPNEERAKIPEGYTATLTAAGNVICVQRNEYAAAPVEIEQPAPVEIEQPAPVERAGQAGKATRGPVPEKDFIGQAITGKGWKILFDADAQRTRVCFDAAPTDAARTAVEKAGFYFSAGMNSFNKKLTFKAHRAAVALSGELSALYT